MKISNNYNISYTNKQQYNNLYNKQAQQNLLSNNIVTATPSFKGAPIQAVSSIKKFFISLFKKNYPANIEFSKAKTVEEAKEFAAKYFGVKKIDSISAYTLEHLNWMNEGFTNAYNMFKDKSNLKFPIKVDIWERNCPHIPPKMDDKKQTFTINTHYYDKIWPKVYNYLNGSLYDWSYDALVPKYINDEDVKYFHLQIADFKNLDYNAKMRVNSMIQALENNKYNYLHNIEDMTENLIKNPPNEKAKEILKNVNIDEIKNIASPHKQLKCFLELREKIGLEPECRINHATPFDDLYKALGNYNDKKKRPYKFEDEQSKKIASQVSEKALEQPTWFVSDVFGGVLSGRKFTQDVMDLYKKLEGPKLPEQLI